MLNYKEFCEIVSNLLEKQLPENWDVRDISMYEKEQSNGEKQYGVSLEKGDMGVKVSLCLEKYYQKYLDGLDVDALTKEISDVYVRAVENAPKYGLDDMDKYADIKDKVVMNLMNYEENKRELLKRPHRKIGDIAVVYFVEFIGADNKVMRGAITNNHAVKYEVKEEQLYDLALTNMQKLHPPYLMELNPFSIFGGRSTNLLAGDYKYNGYGVYVLTNDIKEAGAVSVLYPGVCEQIKELVKDDIYIIPSSVDETIIVPKSILGSKDLSTILRRVNAVTGRKEKLLSNNLYEYDSQNKEVSLSKESMVKTKGRERG